MYQFLFIAALFLIVLLALNFEFLLFPNLGIVGLGASSLILGIGIAAYGTLHGKRNAPRGSDLPVAEKTPRPAGCLPVMIGSLYMLTGIGVFILQAIGFFH
jgi:hypothetical protein